MKILVTGGSGQLAKAFQAVNTTHQLFLLDKDTLDITDPRSVQKAFDHTQPDMVIHLASKTRRVECAENKEAAYNVNVIGTKNIAEATKKAGAKLLFVSSNEVFSGRKNTFYTEDDVPDPVTTVGKSKYEAEQVVQSTMDEFFIVRTMWLYSQWSRNFLQTILDVGQKTKKVSLVYDEVGSPTYSFDLATALHQLIGTTQYGTYHVTNTGKASRLEFGQKAFALLGMHDVVITSVPLAQFQAIEDPPQFSPLASNTLPGLGIKMRTWEEALQDFLHQSKMTERYE